jgi:hypothetical protein
MATDSNHEGEPESEEEKAANAFIEALMEGNGKSAAQSLRTLKQLEGFPLEILADLLEDGPSPLGHHPRDSEP